MAARGAVRYGTVSSATGGKKRVFPRDGMGKCSRLFTAGWEWDGNVGSHLADGTGRYRGTGRGYSREIGRAHSREIGREHGREIGREYGRETLTGMVGNAIGNWGGRQRLKKRGKMLPSPKYVYIVQLTVSIYQG